MPIQRIERIENTPDLSPIWVIGDVQGCARALDELLAQPDIVSDLNTNAHTQIWFAGDLTNRGPDSLGTLRRIRDLGERAVSVLGNHDLHLLAMAAGVRRPGPSDTFIDVLNAPDAAHWIDWLRHRPLAHHANIHGQEYLMVHAGVLPQWSLAQTLACAHEVERALQADDWQQRLAAMYGNEPSRWQADLRGEDRLRIIVNALTRLRMCRPDGRMEFAHKGTPRSGSPQSADAQSRTHTDTPLIPWFDVRDRITKNEATIVFGHWSTLGLMLRSDAICLDTGCIWGGQLTALRLHDRKLVQICAMDPPA